MLSCSIRFSVPSFWMGGGLESRCVGRVYGADGLKIQHISTDCLVPQDNYFHIQCCKNLKLRSRFDLFNLKK